MTLKVMIIRPGALGDTLMLLPAIIALRPSADIVLLGRLPGIDFFRPYVNRCIDFEGSQWHQLFLDRIDHSRSFPMPQVDHIIVFLNRHDGVIERNLTALRPEAAISIFPAFPPEDTTVHVAFYLAQCLQRAQLPIDAKKAMDEAYGHALFEGSMTPQEGSNVMLHPGSGGRGKNHPPDFWISLMTWLRKKTFPRKDKFQLLLGPAEESLYPFFSEKLRDEHTEIILIPEKKDLILQLKQTQFFFGHDSGITHLAAMHGIPTIAFFKETSVSQWHPLGPKVKIVANDNRESVLIEEALAGFDTLMEGNGISHAHL